MKLVDSQFFEVFWILLVIFIWIFENLWTSWCVIPLSILRLEGDGILDLKWTRNVFVHVTSSILFYFGHPRDRFIPFKHGWSIAQNILIWYDCVMDWCYCIHYYTIYSYKSHVLFLFSFLLLFYLFIYFLRKISYMVIELQNVLCLFVNSPHMTWRVIDYCASYKYIWSV